MASNRRRLRKTLTYRDLGSASLTTHAEHWRGFTFQGGPFMVQVAGPWGLPQVWASSEAEGRRVLSHAAAVAGWNLDGPNVEWSVVRINDSRLGRSGTFRVRVSRGLLMVSKREGSSGAPESIP